LAKVSATDNDTQWVDAASGGSGTAVGFVLVLGSGATIADRVIDADTVIPDGWTVSDASVASTPDTGSAVTTLSITHNLGMICGTLDIWQMATGGPPGTNGATRIDLTAQGEIKTSEDFNYIGVNDLPGKTTAGNILRVVMSFV